MSGNSLASEASAEEQLNSRKMDDYEIEWGSLVTPRARLAFLAGMLSGLSVVGAVWIYVDGKGPGWAVVLLTAVGGVLYAIRKFAGLARRREQRKNVGLKRAMRKELEKQAAKQVARKNDRVIMAMDTAQYAKDKREFRVVVAVHSCSLLGHVLRAKPKDGHVKATFIVSSQGRWETTLDEENELSEIEIPVAGSERKVVFVGKGDSNMPWEDGRCPYGCEVYVDAIGIEMQCSGQVGLG